MTEWQDMTERDPWFKDAVDQILEGISIEAIELAQEVEKKAA